MLVRIKYETFLEMQQHDGLVFAKTVPNCALLDLLRYNSSSPVFFLDYSIFCHLPVQHINFLRHHLMCCVIYVPEVIHQTGDKTTVLL